MADTDFTEAQRAEMRPDMYGGKNCDQLVPGWTAYAMSEESEDVGNNLSLSARAFPPGTVVIVKEPVCPTCGDRRSPKHPMPTRGPIPMRLRCPACNAIHVDEGEFATKPHHTHACQACGEVWRPAVVSTVGVQFLPGFQNNPQR